MQPLFKVVWSSVGKKFIMALSGLAMVVFLVEHVVGNLLLYSTDPDPYNKYGHFLVSLGSVLIVVEYIFVAILLFHAYSGITIALGSNKARPIGYYKVGNASGDASRKTFSSKTMIWTGILTFVFIVIHLKTFKFGAYYASHVGGEEIRDLHTLVWEVFRSPAYVLFYVITIFLLGFHLRHGFWSAFQSLGVNHPRYSPFIYCLGILIAIAVAAGFIGIPVWIYFTGA